MTRLENGRVELIVELRLVLGTSAHRLIFDEVFGMLELSDIVIVHADPAQQGVGTDGFRRLLRQGRH